MSVLPPSARSPSCVKKYAPAAESGRASSCPPRKQARFTELARVVALALRTLYRLYTELHPDAEAGSAEPGGRVGRVRLRP